MVVVAERIADILRSTLTQAEQDRLLDRVRQVLVNTAPTSANAPLIEDLSGGRVYGASERVRLETAALLDYFQRRRALLDGALTASQTAKVLGTSRQTPHDRVESGSLLAVMDRGALRFPPWQFDPEGPDGVVRGLPDVIRASRVSPLATMGWLTHANSAFDGATPLTVLKQGNVEAVVDEAAALGVA